jgi:hypothetical protein
MGHEVAVPSPFGGLGPARSSLGTTQTEVSVATQPAPAVDPPAIRGGTRLLRQAIEAEADTFIEERRSLADEGGHQRFVRNGYLPVRLIQTCIGDIAVRLPRVRDLAGNLRFQSRILRPYQRRAHGDRQVFLAAYLRGFLTGDFVDALAALLGCSVLCLPTGVKIRLKALWHTQHTYWLDLLRDGLYKAQDRRTGQRNMRLPAERRARCTGGHSRQAGIRCGSPGDSCGLSAVSHLMGRAARACGGVWCAPTDSSQTGPPRRGIR